MDANHGGIFGDKLYCDRNTVLFQAPRLDSISSYAATLLAVRHGYSLLGFSGGLLDRCSKSLRRVLLDLADQLELGL